MPFCLIYSLSWTGILVSTTYSTILWSCWSWGLTMNWVARIANGDGPVVDQSACSWKNQRPYLSASFGSDWAIMGVSRVQGSRFLIIIIFINNLTNKNCLSSLATCMLALAYAGGSQNFIDVSSNKNLIILIGKSLAHLMVILCSFKLFKLWRRWCLNNSQAIINH